MLLWRYSKFINLRFISLWLYLHQCSYSLKPCVHCLLWKMGPIGSIWSYQKNCKSISFQCLGELLGQCHYFMAKKSLKVRDSGFSGFHGNPSQFFWILGNHHPKGYIPWKFHLSSPNGLVVKMWVTNSDSDKRAIYKLLLIASCGYCLELPGDFITRYL